MYSSPMTITIKDRLDLARTSHFPLDVPVCHLSSLSKIPRKQKDVLKWTRVMRSLWELLRMVTTCEWKAVSINVFHPPSRLSPGYPKVTVDDELIAGSRTWEPEVIDVWQCS